MSTQSQLFGPIGDERVRVYLSRWCQCYPCWCGKCTACGSALTKHAFTEDDAREEAIHVLERDHVCHAKATR